MNRAGLALCCAGLLAVATQHPTSAQGEGDWSFQRVGTFANYRNAPIDESVAREEIRGVFESLPAHPHARPTRLEAHGRDRAGK